MLRGSAGATAALLLAGCSSAVQHAAGGSTSGGAGGSNAILTLGSTMDLVPDDFLGAGANTPVQSLVFDTLAVLGADLQARPSVATAWHYNGDRTELTVDLRDDVRYHTGRRLTPGTSSSRSMRYASPTPTPRSAGWPPTSAPCARPAPTS